MKLTNPLQIPTQTRARIHTHTCMDTQTHPRVCTHKQTHAHGRTYAHTPQNCKFNETYKSLTNTRTHTHVCTHTRTHTRAHTHTHMYAHTHPHMYAHTNTTELQRSPTGTFAVQFSCVRIVASPRDL